MGAVAMGAVTMKIGRKPGTAAVNPLGRSVWTRRSLLPNKESEKLLYRRRLSVLPIAIEPTPTKGRGECSRIVSKTIVGVHCPLWWGQ